MVRCQGCSTSDQQPFASRAQSVLGVGVDTRDNLLLLIDHFQRSLCTKTSLIRRRVRGGMDPAVLIFLLYVMIAHELVCGLMQHRKQSAKPRKRAAAPLLRSSARVYQGVWRMSSQSGRSNRGERDLRKSGRIVRKA